MIVDETFLDRVAHDLRGELSTMLAGVHYLLRFARDVPAPSRDMLERVGEAGERLARLLEEFDDTAWLLDKPKPLLLAPVTMHALLDDLVNRSAKLAALRGTRLELDFGDMVDREFVADADMLARALLYVADFAMLRAADGAVHVKASFDGEAPIVRVEDTGAAVPEQLRQRLLEPFVENELVPLIPQGRRKVRLGLGLAISRAIVEAHGGSVVIESVPSQNASAFAFRCVLKH